jgi:hypothetical protein
VGCLNKHKVLAIVAYILIIVGFIGIAWSIQPSKSSGTVTIPAGAEHYSFTKISLWMYGHVSGNYTVVGTGTVEVFVLNSAQYAEYAWDLEPSDSLNMSLGATGSFSADLADTSTYYIAVNHGAGYDSMDQQVKLTYKVSGLDLMYLIGGVVVLVIGVVLAVVSMRMKAKAKAMEPAPLPPVSQPTDVTMFDTKRKT